MELFTTIAKEYGLFVALVAYILWFFDKLLKENRREIKENRNENAKREARYIDVIDKLSDSFSELAFEVQQIKVMMQRDHDEIKKNTKEKVAGSK